MRYTPHLPWRWGVHPHQGHAGLRLQKYTQQIRQKKGSGCETEVTGDKNIQELHNNEFICQRRVFKIIKSLAHRRDMIHLEGHVYGNDTVTLEGRSHMIQSMQESDLG